MSNARLQSRLSTQRPSDLGSLGVPPSVLDALRQPGRPLTPAERRSARPELGHRLDAVRVLNGETAARSADEIGADAYTFGNRIAFGRGQDQPGSPRTRELLAHELTHVAQQPATPARPEGIAGHEAPAEREVRLGGGANVTAAPSLVYRQEKGAPGGAHVAKQAPAQAEETPAPQKAAPEKEADEPAPVEHKPDDAPKPADLKTRVRDWLDREHFSMPLVLDSHEKPPEQWHAYYSEDRKTLAAITDDTFPVLSQTTPEIKRGDVWQHVYQYYQEKEAAIDAHSWQWVIQGLYTPSYTIASSAPITGTRWQNPLQGTVGATYAAHKAGYGGLEHQFAVTGSFFNLGSGHRDWFQNALAQYQLSAVTPIGQDFKIGDTWSTVQASIYAQIAAGVGATWDSPTSGERTAHLQLVLQPGLGGQLTVSIGLFQLYIGGTAVYTYLGKTNLKDSKPSSTFGIQPGAGFGFTGSF